MSSPSGEGVTTPDGGPTIRELRAADTVPALELLRPRPLRNVFLEYVVRSGALGRAPGFFGAFENDALVAMLMIGPGGSTVLETGEAAGPRVVESLAGFASRRPRPPRHVVGAEAVTTPFAKAYARQGAAQLWERSEPVYQLERAALVGEPGVAGAIEPAAPEDLAQVVENSAAQHLEDLGEDRRALDPQGFLERHESEIRDGRWWVLRDGARILFQVHVGPRNRETVQIGGVFTRPEERNRGRAASGVGEVAARLLEAVPSVTLFCGEDNRPARRLYERLGFREIARYRSYLFSDPRQVSR